MNDPKHKPGDVVIYKKKYSFIDTIEWGRLVDEQWEYGMAKTNKGCPILESEIIDNCKQ
jgi:hypothetical protein